MEGMANPTILGYADRLSVAPGDRIRFMVSCEEGDRYRADLVQLIHGYTDPAGPGFKERVVEHPLNGERPGRRQHPRSGSYVVVDGGPDPTGSFSLAALLWPTTPAKGVQGVLTRWSGEEAPGWGLFIDERGRAALWLSDGRTVGRLSAGAALHPRVWQAVVATFDADGGRATLAVRPLVSSTNAAFGRLVELEAPPAAEARIAVRPTPSAAPLLIAAHDGPRGVVGHYNGKLERPRIVGRALSQAEVERLLADPSTDLEGALADWDFAAEIRPAGVPSLRVSDRSGNGHGGRCVNLPTRAVTGHAWDASEERYLHAPRLYAAIHFHDDDVEDVGWEEDFSLTVPEDLPSGVFAMRLRASNDEDHIPFFVRPRPGRPTAKIAFLAPTASYLAYANEKIAQETAVGQAILAHTPVLQRGDVFGYEHPEFGHSTYDLHSDGSGVCYSSCRRPIFNMRPRHKAYTGSSLWQFPADLCLIDWLDHFGYRYDVLTDEDLDREGVDLLQPYRVVLTGTHPEYVSTRMLDGLESYLNLGGRLMYLGANGFYWIIAFHPERSGVIEVRKAESGSRAWQAQPGEYYLATTGERSGLWRNRGRPPQKLVGVGFSAEGFDVSSPYRRLPDSYREEAAFIFAGVEEELIGDFGLVGGGAAGLEVDRYDLALGTPPHTLLLASSEGRHSDGYQHVVEEVMFMFPGLGGTQDYQVRADMTYFTTRRGGGVFSTGSIAWCGSLSHAGYENNVSRITRNVLDRFAQDDPLPPVRRATA
ncbi:MAG TPA: N,N-dimethylformamidase beta subunit family domain-containing protein [Candidatus Dormibacteraeota bacterium]|nr:N,N-dimethylformamidase beta subunit family domain-containing protein [Candidatus Dormibacteraeota bacterium]